MNKIYTATVKQNLSAFSDLNKGERSVLYPGDMISIVDANNGYYYILEYNTINEFSKENLKDSDSYAVGKWISKDIISDYIKSNKFTIQDTGLETDFKKLSSKGQPIKSTTGPNDSWTESLNASYSITPRTELGKTLSSPKVALDVRRNTYEYTKDRITKKNDYRYIVNGAEYITGLEKKDINSNNISIGSVGLPIKSLVGILGIPHQFTAITDPRIYDEGRLDDQYLGRVYANNIIKTIPLLLITPGVPHFAAKKTGNSMSLFGLLDTSLSGFMSDVTQGFGNVINPGNGINQQYMGKYYRLQFQYVEYYYYVDVMLRAAAQFLDIGDEKFLSDLPLSNMRWIKYNTGLFSTTSSTATKILSLLGFSEDGLLYKLTGSNQLSDCVAFYANCGENVTDNFNNSLTESSLANSLNSITDTAREAQFVAGGMLNMDLAYGAISSDTIVGGVKKGLDAVFNENIVTSLLSKAQTLLAGGRLVFPKIWNDSSFDRSYSISMKLVSPSADKLSIFFSILVPLYHILPMILSQESTYGSQGYIAPFILRMYYKGKFNAYQRTYIITPMNNSLPCPILYFWLQREIRDMVNSQQGSVEKYFVLADLCRLYADAVISP